MGRAIDGQTLPQSGAADGKRSRGRKSVTSNIADSIAATSMRHRSSVRRPISIRRGLARCSRHGAKNEIGDGALHQALRATIPRRATVPTSRSKLARGLALNEHQQDVQRRARAFAATELAPVAAALDRTGSIPRAIIDAAGRAGLLGPSPDFIAYVAGLIEISKEWAALGAVIAVHNSLVCYPISRFGNAAQKQKYLSILTEHQQLGCYAFAEPAAGSDAGAFGRLLLRTGHFVLNGHKRFVTSGRQHGSRSSTPSPIVQGRDGLSAFIVETDRPASCWPDHESGPSCDGGG